MWAELGLFVVDLLLALAILSILYAVYLMAATGIFILALFYIFKGEMEKNYDLHKGRIWVLDASNASGKLLAGSIERIGSRTAPVPSPASREGPFLSKESGSLF